MPSLLWIILPYLAVASFALGHVWRYRRDRFHDFTHAPEGDRLQRAGLVLFRSGVGLVIGMRVADLLTSGPNSHATGTLYAVISGVEFLGGAAAAIGGILLFLPDLIDAPPRAAVTPLDRITVPALLAAVFSGVAIRIDPNSGGDRYRTAETVFTWIRSLPTLHPNADAMRHAPVIYQARALILLLILAIWPYTRLSGTFAGPIIRLWRRISARTRGRTRDEDDPAENR